PVRTDRHGQTATRNAVPPGVRAVFFCSTLRLAAWSGQHRVETAQFGDGLRNLLELLLEQADLLTAFRAREHQRRTDRPALLCPDHFADFAEHEAEFLGFQDQREPLAVLPAVEPSSVLPQRRYQPLALIEA